ncbi:hypothetical protein OXX80_014272, partial [Metschnikowia pulcherrima]
AITAMRNGVSGLWKHVHFASCLSMTPDTGRVPTIGIASGRSGTVGICKRSGEEVHAIGDIGELAGADVRKRGGDSHEARDA